jgi:hypothetical protein
MVKAEDAFEAAGRQLGLLVKDKNQAYGDSFTGSERMLRILYPDGIEPEQYGDVLPIVRIIDKLKRLATRKNAFGESPYQDIAGYGLRGLVLDQQKASLKQTLKELEDE